MRSCVVLQDLVAGKNVSNSNELGQAFLDSPHGSDVVVVFCVRGVAQALIVKAQEFLTCASQVSAIRREKSFGLDLVVRTVVWTMT